MGLRSRAHLIVLAAGMLAAGLAALLVALEVSAILLDETVYKASAVHYTSGLPGSLLHDAAARATARLYPLLLAPLFAVFDGDLAVRLARGLTALLYVASALPVYLLARAVVRSPWAAVAAALGTITAPWLVLGTAIFSEALSLLLFCWALLAMLRALHRPAPWRDGLVLALLIALTCTRIQLGALLAAWLVVVAVWQLRAARDDGRGRRDLRALLRGARRDHPVTLGAAVLALLALVALLAAGGLRARLGDALGDYWSLQERRALPPDAGLAASVELLAFAIGVGLIPAILALSWLGGALAGRLGREQRDIALLGSIVLGVLFTATLIAQNGYLGMNTEERYYVYGLPLLWIGAVAAWEDARVRRAWMAIAAGALVLLAATVDAGAVLLDGHRFFLAPAEATVAHVTPRVSEALDGLLGLTLSGRRDLVAVAVLLAGALTLALVRSRRRWWLAGLAVAAQLAMTAYALQGTRGALEGVAAGRAPASASFAQLGWIDRATPGDARVTWLDNGLRTPQLASRQRATLFYNDEIAAVARTGLPDLSATAFPLDTLPATELTPATAGLPDAPAGWVVAAGDSPLLQIGGSVVATNPAEGLELRRVRAADGVTWAATALDGDGVVSRRRPARALARGGVRATLLLRAPAAGSTSVTVRAGALRREARLDADHPARLVELSLCSRRGPVAIAVDATRTTRLPDGRDAGAVLGGVHLTAC